LLVHTPASIFQTLLAVHVDDAGAAQPMITSILTTLIMMVEGCDDDDDNYGNVNGKEIRIYLFCRFVRPHGIQTRKRIGSYQQCCDIRHAYHTGVCIYCIRSRLRKQVYNVNKWKFHLKFNYLFKISMLFQDYSDPLSYIVIVQEVLR
jgi:hypothetical protein